MFTADACFFAEGTLDELMAGSALVFEYGQPGLAF